MLNKDQMKLGLWLAGKQQQPWSRGTNDCCTLFMEYHDYMFGTDTLKSIYGKYNSLRGAIRLRKKFPTVNEWFPTHGYHKVDTPQTGDVVMVRQRFFPSSYIICQNTAWGISDEHQRMTRHVIEEPRVEYSIWRHEAWA